MQLITFYTIWNSEANIFKEITAIWLVEILSELLLPMATIFVFMTQCLVVYAMGRSNTAQVF